MARGRAFIGGVVVAASLGFGVGAVATSGASSSSSSTVYYGCLNAGSLINVTTLSHSCAAGASRISWNATGPQGVQGLKGDQGIQGLKGDTGATGPAGPSPTGGYFLILGPALKGYQSDPTSQVCHDGSITYEIAGYESWYNQSHSYSLWSCPFPTN